MTHEELIQMEWDASWALRSLRRFARPEHDHNLKQAEHVLAAVRSAGQWLCDPATTAEVRQQVIDSMCQDLFGGTKA